MRLELVTGKPFVALCIKCSKTTTGGDGYRLWADLDGKPYEAYYHEKCLDEIPRSVPCQHPACS